MTGDVVIKVESLSKQYVLGGECLVDQTFRDMLAGLVRAPWRRFSRLRGRSSEQESVWALRDVSFEVKRGEILGIIGPNGAGKSTLLKVLSRITAPTKGEIEYRGRMASLLEVGTGFHPELSGRENIFVNGAILGMTRVEIENKFDEIVDFSGVEKFLDTPVKRYSSGMYVRLAFSIAAHMDPDIVIIDEVLAVGDASFQKKCLGKLGEASKAGRTVLFVSHNMRMIQSLCSSAMLLRSGEFVLSGNPEFVIGSYLRELADVETEGGIWGARRPGDRSVRATAVRTVADGVESNTLRCGQDLEIQIDYTSDIKLRELKFHIVVDAEMGEHVLCLGTDYVEQDFAFPPSTGVASCIIEDLPLMPGRYHLNLFCHANGYLGDEVQRAATIWIVDGDYYGSGKVPPRGYGSVLVDHKWTIR